MREGRLERGRVRRSEGGNEKVNKGRKEGGKDGR